MLLFIYDLLYTLPLSLLAVFGLSSGLRLFEPSLLLFFLTAGFCIYFCSFLRIGKWGRILEVLLLFLTVFLIVWLVPEEGERAVFLSENRSVPYCFGVTLIVFLFERFLSRFLYVKCAVALIFVLGLAALVITGYTIPGPAVAAALFFVLLTAAEAVRENAVRSPSGNVFIADRDRHVSSYLSLLSPFLIAVFVYCALYKAPEEPYDWAFAKKIYSDVSSFVDRINVQIFQGRSESYEDGEVGFSENALFPGAVESSGREVMVLTGGSSRKTQLYLRGKTFTDFTGRTWTSDSPSVDNELILDYCESIAAVRIFDREGRYDYIRQSDVTVSYRYFSSKHYFHPLKAYLNGNPIENRRYNFSGANVIADGKITYKDEYSMQYWQLNRSNPQFEKLLKEALPLDRAAWEKEVLDVYSGYGRRLTYELYLDYQEEMKDTYGQAPVLSARTKDWLREVTDGAESAYEKTVKIEEALKKQLSYDASPGMLPDRVQSAGDFLDWFLFEGKRGYCNHFGTAMTLLCRAAGVPARYVQGFIATVSTTPVSISSGAAHSWCEVYIAGFGWLTMDASPGFGVDSSWLINGGGSEGGFVPSDPDETEEGDHELDPEVIEELERKEQERIEEEARKRRIVIRTLVIALITAILTAAGVAAARIMLIRKRYRDADAHGKMKTLMTRIFSLLSAFGLTIGQGETLEEFGERIAEEGLSGKNDREKTPGITEAEEGLPRFLEDYEKMLFLDRLPENAVRNAEKLEKSLRKAVSEAHPVSAVFTRLRSLFKA